jgi:hypothetical protein
MIEFIFWGRFWNSTGCLGHGLRFAIRALKRADILTAKNENSFAIAA